MRFKKKLITFTYQADHVFKSIIFLTKLTLTKANYDFVFPPLLVITVY